MRSKAAIGTHPLHPMLVPIPIGAFALALVGDIAFASTAEGFWARFAYYCIGIGIVTALFAAVFGAIDYFSVRMSAAGKRIATYHLGMNLAIVALYAVSFYLRMQTAESTSSDWTTAMTLEVVAFVSLLVSGWLGGKLSYEHKVGVPEFTDREANEIGLAEAEARV